MTDLWTKARTELSTRVSPDVMETWLVPTALDSLADGALVLRVPTRFHGEWLTMHYAQIILEGCRSVLEEAGQPGLVPERMRFVVDPALASPTQPSASTPLPPRAAPEESSSRSGSQPPRPILNPKYTFDSFVVGPSNQLAHAVSAAAASSPGKRYNPLFLCGGVGLGKTHLVNAIGQQILAQNPGARILYVSAERFTNEFISAIRNQQMEQFRATYRESCDVLLMDDLQFLANRQSTMEEFFHTFNALHHLDKQIVVTSDVYPEHLDGMEARIVSRFQSGMVADIQAPDVDTRVAILEKKAEIEGIVLEEGVANFLALSVKSNVRELEGTLLRLAVHAELLGKRMDLELARQAMRATMPRVDTAASVEDIQKAVCEYYSLRLVDLKSKRRHRAVSFPRMLAMYLCRQHLGTSYPELGDRFGGKDHTTVIHAIRKITGLVEDHDTLVEGPISAIERKLGF